MLHPVTEPLLAGLPQSLPLVVHHERLARQPERTVANLAVEIVAKNSNGFRPIRLINFARRLHQLRRRHEQLREALLNRHRGGLLRRADRRPIEVPIRLQTHRHDVAKQRLVVPQRLVARDVGAAALDEDRADVLVLALDRAVRARFEPGLQEIPMRRLVVRLARQLQGEHVEVVGDDRLHLETRPGLGLRGHAVTDERCVRSIPALAIPQKERQHAVRPSTGRCGRRTAQQNQESAARKRRRRFLQRPTGNGRRTTTGRAGVAHDAPFAKTDESRPVAAP